MAAQFFYIRSTSSPKCVWSNDHGWVRNEAPTLFTAQQRDAFNLPVDGQWESCRKPPFMVVKIMPTGEVEMSVQPEAPSLKQLQQAVGGHIETLPHFTKMEFRDDGGHVRLVRGVAVVDEEDQNHTAPYNEAATMFWRANLGKGPFWYEPKVHGILVFYARMPRK